MAERRKIIIETGAAQDEPLSTPHFDTEATLTARPVVPLSGQETYQKRYGDYRAHSAKPFWKRPALLVTLILAAVGIGVVAGFAIGLYRNRNAAQTPVTTSPTPALENTDLSQTVEPPPAPTPEPEASNTVPEEREEESDEPSVVSADNEREREARNERRDDDNEVRQPVVAKPPPAPAREKKPVKVDEYEIEDEREARRAERARRREERRERRRRQREEELDIPRGIERGVRREADRIREIFEGRQP
jgi:hypothetical protein